MRNSYLKIRFGSSRLLKRLSDNFLLEATVFEVAFSNMSHISDDEGRKLEGSFTFIWF